MSARILVVDDDEDIRWAMSLVLEDAGYEVFEAPDGKPALTQLADSTEGMVVLLDLQMPGMNGVAVLHALATEGPELTRHAITLVAGRDHRTLSPDVAQLLMRLGIPVLDKPFDIEELVEAVQEAEHWLTPLPHSRAVDA